MSRIINRAEAWERAYETFNQINFNAFDYNTIKQSMLDYMKLFFPEDFNDYIESDEFIPLMELFAYLGELLAYRIDLNAHENFITQAQRKESILRLAKLISYKASRNIPARGLVKMTSISTTEQISDSNGLNLANVKINWNDTNNANWKEQFLLIMNRILRQDFGSVAPTERVQVDDVLFELYDIDNNPIPNGVFSYAVTVSGESLPMELVPSLLTDTGPEERRPDNTSSFSMLYGQDGLGDGSDTTGFFMFTKQGSLTKETTTFDGVTPNQTYDINTNDINDSDVWLNNIDSDTGETLDDGTVSGSVSGEWVEVDLANAQNIIFNTNERLQKYEIETLSDDQVRIIFGDGEFADIPSGSFDIWYRTSQNADTVVPQTSAINKTASFTYVDDVGNVQTLTFTFSLISSLQNAAASEDIDHIRRVAPSVYYTQDRMVNNRDYNVFMLQDSTILKLRAFNRTFAGDSKYLYWHDPSESYESVKLFGCDVALYIDQSETFVRTGTTSVEEVIDSYIEPILSTTDFFTILTTRGVSNTSLRKNFTVSERSTLSTILNNIVIGSAVSPLNIYLVVNGSNYGTFDFQANDGASCVVSGGSPVCLPGTPLMSGTDPIIKVEYNPTPLDGLYWTVSWNQERLVMESSETRFWNTNANHVIDYETLNSVDDSITIIKANLDDSRHDVLSRDWEFKVLGQQLAVDETRDIHRLSVLPVDSDNDNIADDMDLGELLDGQAQYTSTGTFSLEYPMLVDDFDEGIITVVGDTTGTVYVRGGSPSQYRLEDSSGVVGSGEVATKIVITSFLGGDTSATLNMKDYLYFYREDSSSDWELQDLTASVIEAWYTEAASVTPSAYPDNLESTNANYRRLRGRMPFNFAWFHVADRFRLIDPAQTNIIDIYIIPRGYITELNDWLSGKLTNEPEAPSSLDLRLTYGYLIDSKMISDTVVLRPGLIKLLFGSKAITQLQAKLKVIRSTGTITDNQVKTTIVDVVETFFDINVWEFGENFYFTELASAIHNELKSEIDSVVIVPQYASHQFGDLFQVVAREDEIFQADIGVEDIEIIQSFTSLNLRQDI